MTNVELIKAGKLAIRNDDKEAAVRCIKHIWPNSMSVKGNSNLYGQADHNTSEWTNIIYDLQDLPTILATELLKEIEQPEWKPKRGELVEVSGNGVNWYERIFLTEVEGTRCPFHSVSKDDEGAFKIGEKIDSVQWKHIRPIPTKHKVTQSALLAEYAKAKGIEVSQIEITD